MIKKTITFALLIVSSVIFAQDDLSIAPFKKPQTKREVLDSIKASFVHDNIASCIDSLWMKELASLDLYNELTLDIKNINVDEKVDYELPTELLKERLRKEEEYEKRQQIIDSENAKQQAVLEKERINAYRQIAVEYAKNQPAVIYRNVYWY